MATPTMDLSMWRRRARIVAYIYLVLCILALHYTVYRIFLGVSTTAVVVTHGEELKQQMEMDSIPVEALNVFMWMTWITIVLLAITVSIEMLAAIMLLKATKQAENDLKLALSRARIWRFACSCFLLLNFILVLYSSEVNSYVYYYLALLQLFFRGILLFIVCNFMSALEQAIQNPSTESSPDNVVVKS